MRLLAVCFSLACLLALPGAAYSRGMLDQPALVRIFAITQGTASVDAGRPGGSAGDRTFQGLILSDRRDQIIGHGSISCVSFGRVLPGTVAQCTGVFVLPRGRIVTLGTRQRRDFYMLAVVGGTGLYSNALGTLIVSTVSQRPRRERLLFSLET